MAKVTAISSLGWAHYSLYEALPAMARLGFDRIDISSFNDYCFHFNFGSPTHVQLNGMLAERSMKAICVNYVPELYYAWQNGAADRFASAYEAKMEHLQCLGIPMMVMHFGLANDRDNVEQQMSRVVNAYNEVGTIAAKYNIRMLIEVPHMYGLLSTLDRVKWVVDRLESSNIGVLVDSSHWGVIGYDIDELFGVLGSRLWHINLRDSLGTAGGVYDLELTPGEGQVEFGKLAESLDRVGYCGDVTAEFEYRGVTLESIEQKYRSGLMCLEKSGWYLPETVKAAINSSSVSDSMSDCDIS